VAQSKKSRKNYWIWY